MYWTYIMYYTRSHKSGKLMDPFRNNEEDRTKRIFFIYIIFTRKML